MAGKVTTISDMKSAMDPAQGMPYAVLHEDADIHLGFYAPANPDPQQPHEQDEYYFVASGSGEIVIGNDVTSLNVGDAIFVPAQATHRFQNHSEDFTAWVLFWGPKKSAS